MTQRGNIALAETAVFGSGAQTIQDGATRARAAHRERVQCGSVIGGRYEIVEFVAEGAFGAVYRARDLEVTGHVVALKLMHEPPRSDEERERCVREVQLIAAVSHPSVVSFKDHGLHRGRFYIVMPWYEGQSLSRRIAQGGALGRAEARDIFQSLAEALSAIHACGIRHQDVKPENILLARFGDSERVHPVLLDLGVGAWGHELMPAFTPAYVAPEMASAHLSILRGEPPCPVDGKADVFALALTLFDALCPEGRDLGVCTSAPAQLAQRAELGVELPRVPALSDLRGAFSRFLAKDPTQRPTARELSRELSILTRAEERRAERRRLRARFGPLIVAAVIVVGTLGFQLRTERVRSKVKDRKLGEQAAQIDEVREALSASDLARRAREHEARELAAENASLVAMLEQARSDQAALSQALDGEERLVKDLRREVRQLGERALDLEHSAVELTERVTLLSADRLELSRALSRSETARRALIDARDQLDDERTRLATRLLEESAERARLKAQLETLEQERSALSMSLSRLRLRAPAPAPLSPPASAVAPVDGPVL